MYHKIQIKFDYGEIYIYRSWITDPFLLEDGDFKGFWMKIKVTLNQLFSNAVDHKIQVKLDYGGIDIYLSRVMNKGFIWDQGCVQHRSC